MIKLGSRQINQQFIQSYDVLVASKPIEYEVCGRECVADDISANPLNKTVLFSFTLPV
jgi:hypothetical protein